LNYLCDNVIPTPIKAVMVAIGCITDATTIFCRAATQPGSEPVLELMIFEVRNPVFRKRLRSMGVNLSRFNPSKFRYLPFPLPFPLLPPFPFLEKLPPETQSTVWSARPSRSAVSPSQRCRWCIFSLDTVTIRQKIPSNTIRDAILTCTQRGQLSAFVALANLRYINALNNNNNNNNNLYRTETTSKKWQTEKLKSKKRVCSEAFMREFKQPRTFATNML